MMRRVIANSRLWCLVLAAVVIVWRVTAFAEFKRTLLFFFSPSCHSCAAVKEEVIPEVEKKYGNLLQIEYHDVTDVEQYKALLALREQYHSSVPVNVPLIFFEGAFLSGRGEIKEKLLPLLEKALAVQHKENKPLPGIDLVASFKNFRPLAITTAGLADGINPCAFTAIVFFISFLAVQGYRRRELAIIGLSFIWAVFLTYLAIGLGLFNCLYLLKGFWIVSAIANAGVGLLSIALGIFSLIDFFKYRRTGKTEGLFLQLPQAVKNKIHGVIGYFYRVPGRSQASSRPHVMRLAVSALVTGFLVSILEAVCTGQLYLPTIIFVMKTSQYKWQALEYLLLYNVMFTVPLVAVFVLALLGTTSEQFASFMRRHLGLMKIILAAVLIGLGVFLLWRL